MAFLTLLHWLRPTFDALTRRNIPWAYRWRLLVLQPLSLLTYTLTALPWAFSRAYTVHWIPARSGKLRALVFRPQTAAAPAQAQSRKLSPIHLDIHGGAFLGGLPEYEANFCSSLAQRSGAVVVSATYRYAPVHRFPAAIDDIDDVVKFIVENAEELWGADPNMMTVSGFSAGGNLALASCQNAGVKYLASTTFYAVVRALFPYTLSVPVVPFRPCKFQLGGS
jgi:acetyl esterase/lipase